MSTEAGESMELYKKGLTLYSEQRYADAIEAYRAALEVRPDWADCMQAMGMSQMHLGKLPDALETLRRATELAPSDPLAFTSLSMVLVRMERIEEAEEAQNQARMLTWKAEMRTDPGS
jgi:tetratricopeptide (TPR) repeat protein